MSQYKFSSVNDCEAVISFLKSQSQEIPQDVLDQYEALSNKPKNSSTPIWDTLKANYPYGKMPQEKIDCVESTVNQLMEDGPKDEEPGLLLGRIQCGKTDTFEDIIGLSFDRGIDIAIVITKGTKALVNQTVKRMKHDYKYFRETDDISDVPQIIVYDIMEIWRNISQYKVSSNKVVFVCKKNAVNLEHLIDMFNSNSFLSDKKVLVVDDEADFASRKYTKDRETKSDRLAKISYQIHEFIKIPRFCRYLQVTATPYCLYLQPDGTLNLSGQYIKSFKPRFTCLVPTHDRYVGGKQYFIDSENQDSMYSHLFHAVSEKCISVLGHENRRYLNAAHSSSNIYGLTYAIVSYFIGTAIRIIQSRKQNKRYSSSAVFHVEISKELHKWEFELINSLISGLTNAILDDERSDQRIWLSILNCYEDFCISNKKAREEGLITADMPSIDEIFEELKRILDPEIKNYSVQTVNSDEQMSSLLDEDSGELELTAAANIFIGGNILDRGVTLKNMICFFYGRNPKNFQQDTVLQHARMYGARSKEDMAVTRLHTTEAIYAILKRMNTLDDQLRDWFEKGYDKDEPNAVFIGYDKNIKPCAASKIKVSNALTIKQQERFVPSGFWTGSNTAIKKTISKIDNMLASVNGHSLTEEFVIDKKMAMEILKLIESTYEYDQKLDNLSHKYDLKELMCALEYCTSKSDGKVFVLHRTNRNMSRLRENGNYIDAPDDGRIDIAPARALAINRPVLTLIRQNGNKEINQEQGVNIGWNNAPFYWPVLMTQSNITPVMFSLEQSNKPIESSVESHILDGINPDEVLKLTFIGDLVSHFGEVGSEYEYDGIESVCETRCLKESTAGRYICKNQKGKWLINENVKFDKEHDNGLYSYNNGNFPFVFKPYKYMLLTRGRNAKADRMLVELFDSSCFCAIPEREYDDDYNLIDDSTGDVLLPASDIIVSKNMTKKKYVDKSIVMWRIIYPVKKVLRLELGNVDNEDDSIQ
jgi:hypothetical protein